MPALLNTLLHKTVFRALSIQGAQQRDGLGHVYSFSGVGVFLFPYGGLATTGAKRKAQVR